MMRMLALDIGENSVSRCIIGDTKELVTYNELNMMGVIYIVVVLM